MMLTGLLAGSPWGCSEPLEEEAAQDAETSANPLEFLDRPFSIDPHNSWPFDHDLPLGFLTIEDELGSEHVLDSRGEVVDVGWGDGRGHDGHDWPMPEGTALLAMADGRVSEAGPGTPVTCGSRGEVQALIVRIDHPLDHGPIYQSLYGHLARIDVEAGQAVRRGDVIGTVGSTGCSSGPHLHLTINRLDEVTGQRVPVDPFGWESIEPDPWADHPRGGPSDWLWRPGQAPRRWRE